MTAYRRTVQMGEVIMRRIPLDAAARPFKAIADRIAEVRKVSPSGTWLHGLERRFPGRYVAPHERFVAPPKKRPEPANDNFAPVPIMVPLDAVPRAPVAESGPALSPRMPLVEEIKAGRIPRTVGVAIAKYLAHETARTMGGENMRRGGGRFVSRERTALWGQEVAADFMLRERNLALLGPLRNVLDRALGGAEMAELAPSGIPIPKRQLAEAGRLRLEAAARTLSATSQREAFEIARDAAAQVWALAGPGRGGARAGAGRPRADNDNRIQSARAA